MFLVVHSVHNINWQLIPCRHIPIEDAVSLQGRQGLVVESVKELGPVFYLSVDTVDVH